MVYVEIKKHPPEVFYKKGGSQKFQKIYRKTLMLESLFNKTAALKACILLKRDSNTGVFLRFRNFYEHLRVTTF